MVRGEIEIARHHAAVNARPRILPVRVAFDGPLPYPLNAYLDSIQYASWTKPDDTPRLLNELLAAIGGKVSPEFRTAPATAADASSQPPPYAAALPVPGGTLDVDDPWYLPRPTDATALSAIREPGQTLTIKGPRQMGKSSLLMRTVKAGLDLGKRVALLDFQLVDDKSKADADLFFRRFAVVDRRAVRAAGHRRRAWDAGYSNPQNCTRYVERQILQPLNGAVRDRDRRDRFDLPHVVLRRLLRHAAELARAARASDPAQLEDARHRPVDVDRTAVLHRSTARVAVQRRRRAAARGLPGRPGRPPQRAASAGRSATPTSSGCTGSIGGHPYLTRKALYLVASSTPTDQRSTICSRTRSTTAVRSAIICATTCCGCRGSPS